MARWSRTVGVEKEIWSNCYPCTLSTRTRCTILKSHETLREVSTLLQRVWRLQDASSRMEVRDPSTQRRLARTKPRRSGAERSYARTRNPTFTALSLTMTCRDIEWKYSPAGRQEKKKTTSE